MSPPGFMVPGMQSHLALSKLARACALEGVAVIKTRLSDTTWGLWDHQARTIYLNRVLTSPQLAATLAHEYVHYLRGDTGPQPPHVERRVDEQAALMLISAGEYAQAEQIVGCNPGALAVELDTTLWVVHAWRRAHQKQLRQ